LTEFSSGRRVMLSEGNVKMPARRIVLHVRKQDWTAVAIDFVIVVVGAFIGIRGITLRLW
jgi:hypothetical protein